MSVSREHAELGTDPSRPRTRARLRSTTGCVTCRRRHIKCDERRPSCANCGKKGRPCQYVPHTDAVGMASASSQRESQSSGVREAHARGGEAAPSPGDVNSESLTPASSAVLGLGPAESSISAMLSDAGAQQSLEPGVSPFLVALSSIIPGIDADEAAGVPADGVHQPAPIVPSTSAPVQVDHGQSQIVLRPGPRAHLAGVESAVFRNYVDNVSLWIDSFSQDQPFHRQVPNLALQCPVLLHACLALSAKQLTLVGLSTAYGLGEGDAVHYYRLALNDIGRLLVINDLARSDEVLAACIVLSTYEMLDVVGDSLGSHLVGVASLLESRQVNGDAGGIRGACYWTWYRHEVWTSLRTGRCLSLDESYWSPPPLESFDHLHPEEVANRVIFLFGQCVTFCNDTASRSTMTADEWLRTRLNRTQYLAKELDEWKRKLPSTMLCYAAEETNAEQMSLGVFGSMHFLFPQSAIANQVYHASRILLCLHRVQVEPLSRSLANCSVLALRRNLEEHRREIFLTANSRILNPWSLVSCQCLYIAGLVTEVTRERQQTLELLDQCQRDSGRKTGYLSTDLQKLWGSQGGEDITGL